MIRFFLLISFILFVPIMVAAQKYQNGWRYHHMHGRVKSVTEISYKAIQTSNGIEKGERKRDDNVGAGIDDDILFDDKGNTLHWILYNDDGSLWKREYYEYDDRNNRIKEIEYDKGDTTYPFIKTFKYDSLGNEIERYVFYTASKPKLDDIWSYNEKDQLIYRIDYSTTEKQKLTRYMYTYDKNEVLVEMQKYDWDSVLVASEVYKNDKNGRIIEKKLEHKDAKSTYYTYKYDVNGNKIEECHYSSKNVLDRKYIYKYDNENRKIEEVGYSDGQNDFNHRYVYLYDKNGNIILDDYYLHEGDPPLGHRTWTYKYDEAGNWIERIEYDESGHPLFIVERKITYY